MIVCQYQSNASLPQTASPLGGPSPCTSSQGNVKYSLTISLNLSLTSGPISAPPRAREPDEPPEVPDQVPPWAFPAVLPTFLPTRCTGARSKRVSIRVENKLPDENTCNGHPLHLLEGSDPLLPLKVSGRHRRGNLVLGEAGEVKHEGLVLAQHPGNQGGPELEDGEDTVCSEDPQPGL